jgi:branched-chain amino acid transport system ATP-binding protein
MPIWESIMALLDVNGICVNYGEIAAVSDVSMRVEAAQVVSILGANGAGKSTLLKSIMGLTPVKSGGVTFDDTDMTNRPTSEIVAGGITLCPEGRRLFPAMTVFENIRMGGYLSTNADFKRRLEYVYSLFPKVAARLSQAAGTMSGGEQQMVAIGRALMAGPKLLLLDEPTLGLAPMMIREVGRIIQEINRSGVAVLLVEQNAKMALSVSDYGYVLRTGTLFSEGTSEALLKDDVIRRGYLGD